MLGLKEKKSEVCTGLGNLQSAKTRSRKARILEKLRKTAFDHWLRSQNALGLKLGMAVY